MKPFEAMYWEAKLLRFLSPVEGELIEGGEWLRRIPVTPETLTWFEYWRQQLGITVSGILQEIRTRKRLPCG